MTQPELVTLIQNGGAVVCLVLAVRWLATKFDDSQKELVQLLRGVIAENTRILTDVQHTLTDCHGKRKPDEQRNP